MATLLSVNFDNHAVGPYTIAMQQADWGADVYQSNGIPDRVEIVEKDGSNWLKHTYPAGKFGNYPDCGMTWHSYLPDLDSVYLSYDLYVEPDFDPVLNGKIPGLAGGDPYPVPSCTPVTGENGWSARLNFWYHDDPDRVNLALYLYHMDKPVECGDPFPYHIDMPKGQTVRITEWVKMNTPGLADGEVRCWVDDKMGLDEGGIRLVTNQIKITEVYWTSYFGGDGEQYAPDTDQYFYFDNVLVTNELPITLPVFKLLGTRSNHPVSDGMRDVVLLTENAGYLPGVISYGGIEQGFATWEDDKITISELDASGLGFGQHSFTVSKPTAAP